MSSFFGKMLYIDLTKGIIETRNLPRKWAEQYTGQKGLGTRILVEDFNIDTDPLGPDNRIVLTTSLMAGTIISSTSKLAITAKSPQTGMITDGSVGGHIGAELKYAGFDAVSITGRAESLSYLYIDPDKQTINPVPDLA
ncbi:MAG: aldehyde ferredoxin oxidoreductase, partial [Spirochaetes bacterium]